MPQKKNPDAAELIRAKPGRITGALVALLTVMKGLPLAYSKDMQEDKEQVFDAADALMLALAAMAGMAADMVPQGRAAAGGGGRRLLDGDRPCRLAGARLGLPFREAHHVTGALVRAAEARGVDLAELDLAVMQAAHPGIDAEVYEVLGVDRSVASRTSYGGTAPVRVREQVRRWQAALG